MITEQEHFPVMGVVSEGTLVDAVLLDKFTDALNVIACSNFATPEQKAKILTMLAEAEELLMVAEAERDEWKDDEGVEWNHCVSIGVEEAQGMLSELAPEGMWFGPNEGDGACFGFWQDEEDDEEPDEHQIILNKLQGFKWEIIRENHETEVHITVLKDTEGHNLVLVVNGMLYLPHDHRDMKLAMNPNLIP